MLSVLLTLVLSLSLVSVVLAGAYHSHWPGIKQKPILYRDEYLDFQTFTEPELVTHLRNLFPSLDSGLDAQGEFSGGGGDGVLSHGELAIRLVRVERDRQRLDAAYHLEKLDKDDDGLLTAEEIGAQSEAEKRRFRAADRNADGWLSESEVLAYFHPDTSPYMFTTLAQETIDLLDLNRDAVLTRDEYDAIQIDTPKKEHLSLLSDYFSEAGFPAADVRTLIKYFDDHYTKRIETETNRLFDLADDNHDQHLSVDELVLHYPDFVGFPKPVATNVITNATEPRPRHEEL